MKKLLIVVMIFTSEICFGQIGILTSSGIVYDSSTLIKSSMDSVIPIKDTISCIMLISDTSLQFYNNSDCINCPRKGYDNFTYWQKGYEVRNKSVSYYWICRHTTYLDEDKKPLSKNIFVWLSKTLK